MWAHVPSWPVLRLLYLCSICHSAILLLWRVHGCTCSAQDADKLLLQGGTVLETQLQQAIPDRVPGPVVL